MAENPTIHGRLALARKGPDEDLRRLAGELSKLGFQIDHTSSLGVNFHGAKSLFEEAFASPVQGAAGGWTFAGRPSIPAALDVPGASVYLPRKPTFFQ